ncbi:dihydrolipoyllysine-residue acetyltransferase [Thiocystis violascens]|uniref:Acetyltransferase component of pyruvate dehydrogenase complex n=1 Tax=Thiocystis violascens (strain ATCC 17096 / DSM 198 / 6111) TaxID=765911 RepID=I3YE58_THIV6|nr:dihydrolipoyllysine-residue acetyltransferase [Thiocystis violascens]AFL75276.1 pyruvate dehydrogenase complex dihydrolipoamide acetyltransferase, long form [Thiocystis violascens DSM 198]
MATVEEILLPDIGDFSNVEVIEILVAPGDRIEVEQSVLTLESEKATIEIPSPKSGVVKEIIAKVGGKISQGSPLMTLEVSETAEASDVSTPTAEPAVATPEVQPYRPSAATLATRPAPKAPGKSVDSGETVSVVLPDVGDFSDVPVVEILIAPGDRIEVNQSLLTLETDKATMEIPSPQAGVVEEVVVKLGDTLNPGDLILTLRAEPGAETSPPAAREAERPPPRPTPSQTATSIPDTAAERSTVSVRAHGEAERRQAPVLPRPEDMTAIAKGRKPHASPGVRRFARQLGVDLARVKGSGPKGRVVKDDVQNFVKQALTQGAGAASATALPFQLPSAPEIDFARFGEVELTELPRIKKISGRHLHRSWITVPHVTQFDEADITELEAFRKNQQEAAAKEGVKLTFLPFLLKVVATALNRMPILKASLSGDGEHLIHKRFTHIGVAVDTPKGLLVPVVRDVDRKSLYALARELTDLSAKARDGKLLPGDMQGGCFSISSLGGIGGTAFTPIVNAPEVAILGVSRSAIKPVWDGEAFAPRLLLPLSLSYDHRVVDGADGARFTALLGQLLGDIRRLLL